MVRIDRGDLPMPLYSGERKSAPPPPPRPLVGDVLRWNEKEEEALVE
jgi:hypothetical protein